MWCHGGAPSTLPVLPVHGSALPVSKGFSPKRA